MMPTATPDMFCYLAIKCSRHGRPYLQEVVVADVIGSAVIRCDDVVHILVLFYKPQALQELSELCSALHWHEWCSGRKGAILQTGYTYTLLYEQPADTSQTPHQQICPTAAAQDMRTDKNFQAALRWPLLCPLPSNAVHGVQD